MVVTKKKTRHRMNNVRIFKESSPSNKSLLSRSIADFKQSPRQSPRRRNGEGSGDRQMMVTTLVDHFFNKQ